MKPLLSFCRLLALLVLLAPVPCALSLETGYQPTTDSLNAKIKEVAASTELDETTRAELTELYQKALTFLETARSSQAASDSFRTARQTADAEAGKVREEIQKLAKTSPAEELNVSAQTPLADIEQLLLKKKANRAAVAAKLSEQEDRLTAEADRPTAIREALSKLSLRKEAQDAELGVPAPANESPLMAEARKWLLQSEGKALSIQLQMLDQELLSQPMRVTLFKAMRDKSALSLERIDTRIQLLERMLSSKRATEAEKARTETVEAVREAMGKHPLVQSLAKQNAVLSEDLGVLAVDLEQVRADETSASKDAKRIEDDYRSTKQKLEIAGLSEVLGKVMLEQRRTLPDTRLIRRKAKQLETRIAAAGLRQIQDHEERRQLQSPVDYVNSLTAQLPVEETESIRRELLSLAEARQALLDKIIATRQIFVRALGELDIALRHMGDAVQNYDRFMAEHLLWVRSSAAPSLPMLLEIPGQVAELLSLDNWGEVLGIFAARFLQSPVLILGVALFLGLLWKRKAMRTALLASGNKVGKIRTDRFAFTSQALMLTLLLAAPWPLLFAVTGWQLTNSAEATGFARAVARALTWVANAGFFLTFFHVLCTPGGLAAAHFRWPEPTIKRLQRGLTRLKVTFLPAAFVAIVVIYYRSLDMGGGLERLAFVIVLLALTLFFYRLFEPSKGVLRLYLDRNPRSALARLRYVWLALIVVLPLVLAGMVVLGYMYTAGTLTENLITTMWLVLSLLVVQQLVIRWLLLTRRRLAFQAAIERRDAARAREAEASEPPGSESIPEQLEEPEVDLVALSQDSRKLLNMVLDIIGIIGVWLIWSKVLPAFGVLEGITLWHHTSMVTGQKQLVPVTLADAGLAVIIAVITVISTKRFPALLEIGVLQHLKMDPGGRYAATTLSRYVIAAVGTILFFGIIGASWSQIQWLVAALGVGIGFGLQEIVANFISGIIILFERPIRVGDTVTVGDTDGVVTRIQIRATTIRNWDGKELLVPNKEFITAHLLNWTLSDPLTRLVVPVGLAYGGDVSKAMSLMLETANEHSRVLEEPRATVVFDQFGDNALSIKLRCFIASMEHRIETISELHQAINKKFIDAGLVIAFPQRDVHLDTSHPLDIRVLREKPEPGV